MVVALVVAVVVERVVAGRGRIVGRLQQRPRRRPGDLVQWVVVAAEGPPGRRSGLGRPDNSRAVRRSPRAASEWHWRIGSSFR